MNTLLEKLTLHSFYFYGLCLLAYLLTRQMGRPEYKKPVQTYDNLAFPIQCILGFGIVILSISFILKLTSTTLHVTTNVETGIHRPLKQ